MIESNKTCQQKRLIRNFTISCGFFKLLAMGLLIYSEYLFLMNPICLGQPKMLVNLYPSAAFCGNLLLALICMLLVSAIPLCDIISWIIIEILSSLLLLSAMAWVCNMTLRNCIRPPELYYFLPEIIGLVVSLFLLMHAFFWIIRSRWICS